MGEQRLILCGGLQSGGTTVISWCFLQRVDTDGVLDMRNDIVYPALNKVTTPIVWVKMTIGSFRLIDVAEIYSDLGWTPEPVLIVRDTRTAYASLLTKGYGFNGTTAEQPPLRTRFRRFLQDWQSCRSRGWPIVRFEDFLSDPVIELQSLCHELSLPWDDAMTAWPKQLSDISYVGTPNETFAASAVGADLAGGLLKQKSDVSIGGLPQYEHEWLEETFHEYNVYHGYPTSMNASRPSMEPYLRPTVIGTIRERLHDALTRLKVDTRLRDNIAQMDDAIESGDLERIRLQQREVKTALDQTERMIRSTASIDTLNGVDEISDCGS